MEIRRRVHVMTMILSGARVPGWAMKIAARIIAAETAPPIMFC